MFHGAILLKQRTGNTILATYSHANMVAFAYLTAFQCNCTAVDYYGALCKIRK